METARRGVALLQIVFAACALCGAATAQSESKRCATDALDKWYCATDPRGTALVDELGRVVCAPGACAKIDEQGWLCSSVPGGRATATPKGPMCDGECRTPETTDCEKV